MRYLMMKPRARNGSRAFVLQALLRCRDSRVYSTRFRGSV